MLGKVVPIRNQFPDGPRVIYMNTVSEGLRKAITMCFACDKFKPNSPDHCLIAKNLHEFTKTNYIAVSVSRCSEFVPNERSKDCMRGGTDGGHEQ